MCVCRVRGGWREAGLNEFDLINVGLNSLLLYQRKSVGLRESVCA